MTIERDEREKMFAAWRRLVAATCREAHGGPEWTAPCPMHRTVLATHERVVNEIMDVAEALAMKLRRAEG